MFVNQRDVKPLSVGNPAQVARRHQLHKLGGIRAGDLHLPLAAHIPDLHMFAQVPVILLDARRIGLWKKHVVDHAVVANAMRLGAARIRGAPDPAGHIQTCLCHVACSSPAMYP